MIVCIVVKESFSHNRTQTHSILHIETLFNHKTIRTHKCLEGGGTEAFTTKHVLIKNTLNKNNCLKEMA